MGPSGPAGDRGDTRTLSFRYGDFTDRKGGDLTCVGQCRGRSDPIGVPVDNFSVEATFTNPTDTARFEYGFTIDGTFESGVSENIEVRVTNDRTWRAYFQRVVLGSAQVNIDQWQVEISAGQISDPFSTVAGGSNWLELTVLGDDGCLYVNDRFVSCFDISKRTSTTDILTSSEYGNVRYNRARIREALIMNGELRGQTIHQGKEGMMLTSNGNFFNRPGGEFSSISTGWDHNCGVTVNGTIAYWGSDRYGRASPPDGKFSSVSAGLVGTCGVKTDGSVACWGAGQHIATSPPVGKFVSVNVGRDHACGVRTDGTVACWGRGQAGEASPPGGQFASVSVGREHTCGVKADGTLKCWGLSGVGPASPPKGQFISVDAGHDYTCGVKADGSLECWSFYDATEAVLAIGTEPE